VITPSSLDLSLDVGNKLKALREIQGFSQRELAKRSGVTHSNISMIEQGQVSPSIQSITRILHALCISPPDFFALASPLPPSVFKLENTSDSLSAENSAFLIEHEILGGSPSRTCMFITLFDGGLTPLMSVGAHSQLGTVLVGDLLLRTIAGELYLTQGDVFNLASGDFYCFVQQGRKTARVCLS
jgi:transcriptional regulator with XRE-family HTH domain